MFKSGHLEAAQSKLAAILKKNKKKKKKKTVPLKYVANKHPLNDQFRSNCCEKIFLFAF